MERGFGDGQDIFGGRSRCGSIHLAPSTSEVVEITSPNFGDLEVVFWRSIFNINLLDVSRLVVLQRFGWSHYYDGKM